MKYSKTIVTRGLLATAILALSSPVLAGLYELAPDRDVNMCVAEIQSRADYTGASRVRHEVDSEKRRSVGYTLEVDTLVYGDDNLQPIRQYKAICVVTGGRKPFEFSMRETGEGA